MLASGLWFVSQQRHKAINAEELRIQLIDLRSQAVQTQLVARLLPATGLTRHYPHQQLALLQEQTETIVAELSKRSAEPRVRHQLAEAAQLAQQIRDIERQLTSADGETVARNKAALDSLARRLVVLEEALVDR
jgi:tRNA/tmRNA/rRNA uracil-C5-methylase (TrmA/RlmC/RlmD family)